MAAVERTLSIIKPDAVFRFGRNTEEIGDQDPDGPGNGLEFKDNDNEIRIQVQKTASTIAITGTKTANSAKYIEVRDSSSSLIFAVESDGEVFCDTLVANNLRSSGQEFAEIRVKTLIAKAGSVWLGDRLHVSETGKRARLQMRADVVPLYLQGLGVVAGDLPSGITLATSTLDHWKCGRRVCGRD